MNSISPLVRFALFFAVVSTLSCAPNVRVKTASDPSASFDGFKTFAMLLPNKALPSENTEVDPFVLQRLRQLTYLQLKSMGLEPVDKAEADLLIAVFATRKERVDVYPSTSYGFGYGPRYGYGYGYGYGPGFGATAWSSQVVRTNEGIVIIDLINRDKNAVVFRGTGIRDVEPDFDDQKLSQMVSSILAASPLAGDAAK